MLQKNKQASEQESDLFWSSLKGKKYACCLHRNEEVKKKKKTPAGLATHLTKGKNYSVCIMAVMNADN